MRWPRENIEAIFQEDRANAIQVYANENIAAGKLVVVYGSHGAHFAASLADGTVPAKSSNALMGVAAFAAHAGDILPIFIPFKLLTGLNTAAKALGDKVYLAAAGGYSYTGTVAVGFVVKVDATDGRILLCPSMVESVAGSSVAFTDTANFWPTDTMQGLGDSLTLLIGGTSATVRNYTANAVLTDNETLFASLNRLDQTYEDTSRAAWDDGVLPTALQNKGFVLGLGTELLVEAQAVPDLTVRIQAANIGSAWNHLGHKRALAAAVLALAIPLPAAGLQRRDIVVLSDAGTVLRRVGVEGAAPSADAILTAGDIPLARVTLTQGGDIAIQAANIADLRSRRGVVDAAKVLYPDNESYYDHEAISHDDKLTVSEVLDQIGDALWSLTPAESYRWFDDFDTYQIGFTEIDHGWLLHGDTNDPDIPATPLAGGVIELITAAAAPGDRCQAVWGVPIRLGAAGVVFDCRFMVNNIVDVALFVGLTDSAAIENPCEVGIGTDVLAANATDLLGVVFDSQGTTQRFHAAAFDGGVPDAGNAVMAMGCAPVNGTWRRIVILSDTTGALLTFRLFDANNVLLGQAFMAGSAGCDPVNPLYATFIVEARGAGARTLSVDWNMGVAGRI